ncbi:hypothetical protein HZA99_05125 [Candidatus Woesearchaeota archaeon]|nr:hypothetical protein [Candidatus Woesearchaeota archaeon]
MELKKLLERPHVFWIVGIALVYISLNMFLSKFYLTIWYVPYFLDTMNWKDFLLSIGLTFFIGILVAINMMLSWLHYQENKHHLQQKNCAHDRKATLFASIGAFLGLAIGVCSACTPIIFPLLLGLFDISLTWSALSINGLQVQLVLVALLITNIYYFQSGHLMRKQKEKQKQEGK